MHVFFNDVRSELTALLAGHPFEDGCKYSMKEMSGERSGIGYGGSEDSI
ncbi:MULTISPECIES: hypothetical protein [Paenibacillus]|nr:hypothetical protein [Paenibacillus odorifer]